MEAIARRASRSRRSPRGASLAYWEPIRKVHEIDLEVVNPARDPTFRFMTLDHDGKIRMDCSSPYAMAGSSASRTVTGSPSAAIPTRTATGS